MYNVNRLLSNDNDIITSTANKKDRNRKAWKTNTEPAANQKALSLYSAGKREAMKKEELLSITDEQREQIISRAIEARHVRNTTPEQIRIATRAAENVAAGQRITVEEFEALTGVMFSHNMTGKMLDILSLSTNCFSNPCCIARMKAGIGICAECFSAGIETQYS